MSMSNCDTRPHLKTPVLDISYLADFTLYGNGENQDGKNKENNLGWELSPEPFWLSQEQFAELQHLGGVLWRFLNALDQLYKDSLNPNLSQKIKVPAWVSGYLNQGKPEALIQFSQMKRLKNQMPLVIRPDLLITDDGFALTEIDSVPGGIGFTSALSKAYWQSGFETVIRPDTMSMSMPEAFLKMLLANYPETDTENTNPSIAVIVSDEAGDYRKELQWLVDQIRATGYFEIAVIHPKDVDLLGDQLVMTLSTGEKKPIDLIYRFFELFDLPNIPKVELIQYAIKKKYVHCTPPFKPYLEEKMMLALLHHPALRTYWLSALGEADFSSLKRLIPPTWVVDPTPLPPHAVIPDLMPAGEPLQSFEGLFGLSQKARQLVLKPSGFSPLAWGSRGVGIGHDMPAEDWQQAVEMAMASFAQTPYVLQTFRNPATAPLERLDLKTGERTVFKAKTRLCPYYLVMPNQAEPVLAGVLATACPADKKIIHGMRDAVLAPCAVTVGESVF